VKADQEKDCSITNGKGTKQSTDGGQTRGECTIKSCNSGYTEVNGKCVKANQEKDCSIANGKGTKQSTDGGQTRGECTVKSCNIGYTKEGNACVKTLTCKAGYIEVNGKCVLANQKKDCSIANGIGTKQSTDGGQTRGECTVKLCNIGYTKEGNACVKVLKCLPGYIEVNNKCVKANQEKDCSIANGKGTKQSTDGGQTRGECTVKLCNIGYTKEGNACVKVVKCNKNETLIGNVCVPTKQDRDCEIENGIGIQYSTDGGETRGKCKIE